MVTKLIIALGATGYGVFGLALLIDPVGVLASAGATVADDPITRIEVRAFYGGLELGLAALLAWFLTRGELRAGLLTLAVSYGAIALARGVSMLAEQTASPFLWTALATELGFMVAGMILLRRQPS